MERGAHHRARFRHRQRHHRRVVLAVISLTAAATMNPTPEQTIIQKVETTGDVKRLCVEARTGEHIEAMSCELIDQQSGGVMR